MQENQAQVAKTREQLSTGKEIVRPSDNPGKVSAIENLDRAIAKNETYGELISQLKDRYQLEETVLTNSADILVRIKDLAIQSANATLSAEDRQIVAVEVESLRDELLSIANTRDMNGNSIFAGGKTELSAFVKAEDGTVSYQGDARQTMVNVSDSRQLGKNRNGLEVFASADRPVDITAKFDVQLGTALSSFTGASASVSDGTTSLDLDGTYPSNPPTLSEIADAINQASGNEDFNYTASVNGASLRFEAKEPGAILAGDEPVFTPPAALVNGNSQFSVRLGTSLNDYQNTGGIVSDGVTTLALDYTSYSDGAVAATEIRDAILNHADYGDFNYTVSLDTAVSPNSLVFTAKDAGATSQSGFPVFTPPTAVTDQQSTVLETGFADMNESEAGETGQRVEGVGFFEVIEDFVIALKANNSDDIERALGEVDDLHSNMSLAIGRVGSELQSTETQEEINLEGGLRLQTLLSAEEDLDYAAAITRFNQEMTRLEATQSSFARVSQLSLFEYL